MDISQPTLHEPSPAATIPPTIARSLESPAQRTAGTHANAGPAVWVRSADPDFLGLLAFLFRYHGFTVTMDGLGVASGPAPTAVPLTLLILDLTDVTAELLLPSAVPSCPTLVLTRPERMTLARQLVPAAAGWLTVPVQPLHLVALARQLLGGSPTPSVRAR